MALAPFDIGDLVTFDYSQGKEVNDQHPKVLVLHTSWVCYEPRDLSAPGILKPEAQGAKRCVHGLNWNNLSSREESYLRAVMNPMLEMKMTKDDEEFNKKMAEVHKLRDLDIQSPQDFYTRLIRPFIKAKNWEPYRRYRVDKIHGARVVESKELLSGAKNDTIFRRVSRRLSAMRGRR